MTTFDASAKQAQLQQLVDDVLRSAKQKGASDCEVAANSSQGVATTVRLGEIETIEHTADNGLGITVFFGQRKGSASTSDLSPAAITETIEAACDIARYAAADPHAGLPDAALLARTIPQLDLYHPWSADIAKMIDMAKTCETAARDADSRISNSEGASVGSEASVGVYGNSLDFNQGYPGSRHSISCSVIAQDGDSMQRDYWYSSARDYRDLDDAAVVGRRAAARTVARLHGRKLGTRSAPVLFKPEMAAGLLRSLIGGLSGGALYRRSSFLLDSLNTQIFPDWVKISENPHKKKGLASAPFDAEGVATQARELIDQGVVQSYVLSSYSARRLGMQSTGNAGGVHNLSIAPSAGDCDALIKMMDCGLIVTEMMGHGLNMVTGDYSRGAAGFWVEKGQIQYPVEEITIAGNLRTMFRDLIAVADDADYPGSIQTGSWLIKEMRIAGD